MPDAQPALSVHDTGTGPALLFLHAFPLDASQWDHQVAAFSGEFRCLRPDIWGCGTTPPHPHPEHATLGEYAAAVVAALDEREITEVVVVGSSMGGYAAFSLLRSAPQRIRGLVFAASHARQDEPAGRDARLAMVETVRRGGVEAIVEPMVQRLLGPGAREEAHIADPLRGRIRRCTPDGIAFCQHAMATRPASEELLGGIGVPTLVVAGADDAVIDASWTRALASGVRSGRIEVMDTGHLPNLENPPAFNEILREYLTAL